MYEIAKAPTQQRAKDIVQSFSYITHTHSNMYMEIQPPRVILQNGFTFTIPSQHCEDPECQKMGFSIRVWTVWKAENNIQPSMRLRNYTTVKEVDTNFIDFGDEY
jgi:hypothetical protein